MTSVTFLLINPERNLDTVIPTLLHLPTYWEDSTLVVYPLTDSSLGLPHPRDVRLRVQQKNPVTLYHYGNWITTS